MNQFTICFTDGSFKNVTEKQALVAQKAQKDKALFFIDRNSYQGYSVARVEEIISKEVNTSSYRDVFQLDTGEEVETKSFLRLILETNITRQKEGKRWIFENVINQVKRLTNISEPEYIFQFIDSDPDEIYWTKNKANLTNHTVISGDCKKCENGWLMSERGAKPCKCNQKAIDYLREKKYKI